MANVVETGGAKAIDWVPLRYNRVQHVVAEINSLALKAKKDRAFLTFLAVDYKDAMKKRAAELKQWSHKAKQEERPEYVLIAKQATRFRQLRSNCEAEVNKVNSGSSTSYGQGSSPALPSASPPVMTPAPLPNSSKVATPPYKSEETSAPTSQSPRSKERRSSVRAAKKRQSSTIAMIKNRLRAAAYHLGKMDFAKLFKYYDRDNSGHIDCKEFMSLIRRDGKIPPSKLSHVQLENIFAAEVDKDGNGEVTHKEFVQWILDDEYFDENGNATSMTDNISTDVHSEPMDTFTRLYLSKPEFTVALKESSPRTRRKSLSEPESGGDFRSILRGGYNSETSRAWRHNYHTKVDTKQTEYPPLYSWEQSTEGEHTYKSGTRQRKFVSPVTKSAERANASNNMANMDKLRNHSKDPSFKNQKNIAFGSRIPPKQPSAEERKKQQAAERAAKLRAEREARDAKPAWRSVCDFQIVMNDDEAALYQRLRLSIPVEKDPFQAAAAKEAAKTATRRLSMFDYTNQTRQLWNGKASTFGAPGSDTGATPPVRPPMPSVNPNIPNDTTHPSTKSVAKSSVNYHESLERMEHIPGYEKMKRAAFAAGVASQNASRRGSMASLTVKKGGSDTTSLMPRSNASLRRELSEAESIYHKSQQTA